jgi:hypothetical protein
MSQLGERPLTRQVIVGMMTGQMLALKRVVSRAVMVAIQLLQKTMLVMWVTVMSHRKRSLKIMTRQLLWEKAVWKQKPGQLKERHS